jgi:hypothetical protein
MQEFPNKYSFKSLETWARMPSRTRSIVNFTNPELYAVLHIQSPESPHECRDSRSTDTADSPRPALLTRLLATMIALLRLLMNSSVQYVYLAMKLADELDLRALRGGAYLQKAVVVKKVRVDVLRASNSSKLVPGDAAGLP